MTHVNTHPSTGRTALILVSSLLWTTSSGARADDVFATRWDPWIETGAQVSSARAIGDADLFVPLSQDSDTLLFADIRGMFDSQDAAEGNFGLGLRQMLPSGWNIGAYGYFDLRRSSYGNRFQQVTLGAEALSEQFDLRANIYLPVGQSEVYMDNGTSTSVGPQTSDAIISGGSLAIRHQSVQTTTTSYEVEKALAGVDAEVGVRLPVFEPGSGFDLRAFAGGYYFDGSDVDPVAGPRARLELVADDLAGLPGVKLTGGVVYQHDEVRGDQWIAQARLRIPLQPPSEPRDKGDVMARRMTDAIMRDVDIVSNSSQVSTATDETLTSTEAAVSDWNDAAVTSFTQIDGTSQDGADLQAALDAAGTGVIVLVNGTVSTTAGIILNEGQTVLGGGTVLRLRGATSGTEVEWTTGGASGGISGSSSALVQMGDDSFLGGISVDNLSTAGGSVAINAADGAVLQDVDVTSQAGGIRASGVSGFTIDGGSVTAGGGNALDLASSTGIDIQNMEIVQNGDRSLGIRADSVTGLIKGNRVTTNGNGNSSYIDTDAQAQSAHAFSIANSGGLVLADNTITTNGTQANGFYVSNSGGIEISGNTVTTNGWMSRGINLVSSDGTVISENVIKTNTTNDSNWYSGTIAYGIMVDQSSNLTITGNDIETQMRGGAGINLRYGANNTISDNVIATNGSGANAISTVRSTGATVRGNTLTTAQSVDGSAGIYFGLYSHNGLAENNTITSPGSAGVTLNGADNVTVRNNQLVGRGDAGVFIRDSNNTTVSGNTP
jgi:parallel beta-helix repeat protein